MTDNDRDKPLYSIDVDDAPLYSLADDDVTPTDADADTDTDTDTDADTGTGTDSDADIDTDADMDAEETGEGSGSGEVDAADVQSAKEPSPLRLLFKTMFTPVEGWKALKRARLKTDTFASRCFYPLIGLCALSEGAKLFYEANVTFADWAKGGLATFLTFFFGYFTVILCGGIVLPKKSRDVLKREIGKQFVMLTMSTLALFWTSINVVPMFEPVLVFLPLWTIYLVYKGVRVLHVSKDVEHSTTGLLCMLIIGVPILWDWLVTEILLPLA